MSSSQIPPSIPLPTVPALPPIVNNTHESGMTPLPSPTNLNEPSTNSAQQQEASSSPPSNACGADNVEICEESGTADYADINSLFNDVYARGVCEGRASESTEVMQESSAEESKNQEFPTKRPSQINRFTNQDDYMIDEGYDSEGDLLYYPPDLLSKEIDEDYYESPINVLPQTPTPAPPATKSSLTEDDIQNMAVKELKMELQKQGRPVSGKKVDLIARLLTAVSNSVPVSSTAVSRHESMTGLDVTANWVELTINNDPVPEPSNDDTTLQPPTERDTHTNPKYGFKEQFTRQPVLGTTENMHYIFNSPKRKKKRKLSPTRKSNPSSKSNNAESNERIRGGPNGKFLKRYGLDEKSHPMDWMNALLPMLPEHNLEDAKVANVKGDKKTKFSISNWTIYSNLKAVMCNAGQEGHIFADKFKSFENEDIFKMLGVYLLDGLSPSPQLTKKMQPQEKEPTHGNDLIADAIGPGYQQLYQSFRYFFGVQDPLLTVPPKEDCPNVKVDEFFPWLWFIWRQAWNLGKNFSVDEQTCKMQGKSEYKTRCGKFKRIGDGIQADCIADDGYTLDFYFRNEPVDKNLLTQGFCPMHCHLIHMFKNLKDIGHECKMDNLFNSVNLARAAYSLPQKVKIHGVIWKSGRGVPPLVFQDEAKEKQADAVQGMVKAAVLKGDSLSHNLIIASCYDQKPFYMISHSIDQVTWVECKKWT